MKVEALQTPQGIKVGDIVKTLPFKQIDGNLFPVIKAEVTKVQYVLLTDLFHNTEFYKVTLKCKPNKYHWRTLEISDRNIKLA